MTSINNFTLELSDLQFVHSGLARPENVLAEKDGTLWTPDNRGSLTRIDPDGTRTTVGSIGPECNGLAMSADGQTIYIAHIGNGNVYKMDRDGQHELILGEIGGQPLGSANDVYLDSKDRLWISVSTRANPWFIAAANPRPDGYIILWDEKGPRIVADGLYFTNEIKMDADEKYLYAAETMTARIVRFPLHEDGSLGEMEVYGPDGLGRGAYVDGFAFDVEGNLWVTPITRNGLGIITPDGDYHTVFEDVNAPALENAIAKVEANTLTPEDLFACVGKTLQFATSVTFGGPDLKTVYVGSLAMPHLVTFKSPVAGLPLRHWG
jgi:gluconolactonase